MICVENGDHKGFVQLFAEGIRQDVKRRLSQCDFSHFFDWQPDATLLPLCATGCGEQKQLIVAIAESTNHRSYGLSNLKQKWALHSL